MRSLNVDGQYYGLSATKVYIIVSFFNPGKVGITNLEGNALVSVRTDKSGQALIRSPFYKPL